MVLMMADGAASGNCAGECGELHVVLVLWFLF